jgi:potassium efflux system protein
MNWIWRSFPPITARSCRGCDPSWRRKQSEQLDAYLQALRNQLNSQRQREAEKALESTELLAENSENLPPDIVAQFKVNRELSQALNQQAQRMDLVASQQRQATNQTLQVRQALNTLREQSQWLGSSNLLGEALRAQVARLPEIPRPQQLDTEMAQLRVQRLRYEDQLGKQPQLRQIRQADGEPLTANRTVFCRPSCARRPSCSTPAARRRYADARADQAEGRQRPAGRCAERDQRSDPPLSVLDLGRQPNRLLLAAGDRSGSAPPDLARYHQPAGQSQHDDADQQRDPAAAVRRAHSGGFSISSRRHFTRFLERSSARSKVTQDHFWLTLRTVFWSILVASPLPVLWMTLGYGLQAAWPFPLAVAIGDGVTATVPLLWVVMICATFARPNGLFIAHFGWPRSRVSKAMRYYLMSIGLIVPLIMALIISIISTTASSPPRWAASALC